jgi:hypothetical protein
MVNWFDPLQLIRTGINALLSGIFGAYADKRELQAALQQSQPYVGKAALQLTRLRSYTDSEEIWIDYIADLGDGWDSTYTMAWLISRQQLILQQKDPNNRTPIATQRGRLLIMGGDQVYPTAKREEYQNRLVGPYKSALPCVLDDTPPHLFAIPGNHDWYDGLTAFTRLFCQQRWIGGWQTQQSRSYFAIKLPYRWWLWGIDIQLDADIDKPQLDYFKSIAAEHMREGGHRIILCTAKPSWVYASQNEEAYHNLDYFERKTIREYGNRLVLTLSGDLHHYSRYQEQDGPEQKITAGGGGAYLYGTHQLPEALVLQVSKVKTPAPEEIVNEQDVTQKKYLRAATFPDTKTSRRLALGAMLFPFKNYQFSLFIGFFYLLFAWIVQNAGSVRGQPLFVEGIRDYKPGSVKIGEVLSEFFSVLLNSPASVVFLIGLIFGLAAFCKAEKKHTKVLLGAFHATLHLALNISLIWGITHFNYNFLGLASEPQIRTIIFIAEMLIAGGFQGSLLMGIYLLLSDYVFGFHTNEVFSAQRIADYKNFVRLHLDKNGRLTIYPVGVTKICRRWKFMPNAGAGESWFEPAQGIQVQLIEAPISVEP